MSITAIVEALVLAGATPEMILAAVRAAEMQDSNAIEQRRASDRERQARRRHVMSRDVTVTPRDLSPSSEGSSPTPPLPKPLTSIPPSPPKGGSSPAGFDRFWDDYPNKVGKRDAEKAFSKAMQRADLDTVMRGLGLYRAKLDDRPWCNPATWLNQDRWNDRPAIVAQARASPPRKSSFAAHQDAVKRSLGYENEPEFSYIDH
jgi:hypothetical protein